MAVPFYNNGVVGDLVMPIQHTITNPQPVISNAQSAITSTQSGASTTVQQTTNPTSRIRSRQASQDPLAPRNKKARVTKTQRAPRKSSLTSSEGRRDGRKVTKQSCETCRRSKKGCNGSPERACDTCAITKKCPCVWKNDNRKNNDNIEALEMSSENYQNTARELFTFLNILRWDAGGVIARALVKREFSNPITALQPMGYNFQNGAFPINTFLDLVIDRAEDCTALSKIRAKQNAIDENAVETFTWIWTLIRHNDEDIRDSSSVSKAIPWVFNELATGGTITMRQIRSANDRFGITEAHLAESQMELEGLYKLKSSDEKPDWTPRVLRAAVPERTIAPVIDGSTLQQAVAIPDNDMGAPPMPIPQEVSPLQDIAPLPEIPQYTAAPDFWNLEGQPLQQQVDQQQQQYYPEPVPNYLSGTMSWGLTDDFGMAYAPATAPEGSIDPRLLSLQNEVSYPNFVPQENPLFFGTDDMLGIGFHLDSEFNMSNDIDAFLNISDTSDLLTLPEPNDHVLPLSQEAADEGSSPSIPQQPQQQQQEADNVVANEDQADQDRNIKEGHSLNVDLELELFGPITSYLESARGGSSL